MTILVDTSVWIDYFAGGNNSGLLDVLIDEDLVVTNDLILAELIPVLKRLRKRKVIELLQQIRKLPLTVDWGQIIDYQSRCLNAGLDGISINDLIIIQNARQNSCKIYSIDHPFWMMKDLFRITLHAVAK